MDFVGRSIWRVLKIILAILAVAGAILIFTSVPCSVVILKYIVAAVLLVAAVCMIIDSAGVEALLNKFRLLINELRGEVEELKEIETDLKGDLKDLEAQNDTYHDENTKHANQIKQLETQLDIQTFNLQKQTSNNVEQGIQISQLQNANANYLAALSKQQAQLQQLASENKTYADNNRAQQQQIDRLTSIEENAKKLITSLMADSGVLESTSERMERVLHSLEADREQFLRDLVVDKFEAIDTDHNGELSLAELEDYAKRHQISNK
jgi:chromosome segregation ATPase